MFVIASDLRLRVRKEADRQPLRELSHFRVVRPGNLNQKAGGDHLDPA